MIQQRSLYANISCANCPSNVMTSPNRVPAELRPVACELGPGKRHFLGPKSTRFLGPKMRPKRVPRSWFVAQWNWFTNRVKSVPRPTWLRAMIPSAWTWPCCCGPFAPRLVDDSLIMSDAPYCRWHATTWRWQWRRLDWFSTHSPRWVSRRRDKLQTGEKYFVQPVSMISLDSFLQRNERCRRNVA